MSQFSMELCWRCVTRRVCRLILCIVLIGLAATLNPAPSKADECSISDETGGTTDGGATTEGDGTFACGADATATGSYAHAVGVGAEATGDFSLAVGDIALATGQWAHAVGNISAALADRSTAIGTGTDAEGADSLAVGWNAFASANSSIAIGSSTESTAYGAIALGTGSEAAGVNSIAIGADAVATEDGQVVLASLDLSTSAQVGPVQVVTADGNGTLGLGAVASAADMQASRESISSLETLGTAHGFQIASLAGAFDNLAGDVNSLAGGLVGLLGDVNRLFEDVDSLFEETAVNRAAIRRANEGVALALAMESPSLPPGTSFALSGGLGYFDNASAGSMAISARLAHNAAFSAGLGVGLKTGEVGARGGFQLAW